MCRLPIVERWIGAAVRSVSVDRAVIDRPISRVLSNSIGLPILLGLPILIGLLFLNVCAFVLMGVDKSRARQGSRRIPERVFFLLALTGAAPGVLAGLSFFRHKTRQRRFTLGIPTILLLQIIGLIVFMVR